MSPIRMGRARVEAVSAAQLAEQATALSMAVLSGGHELDPDAAMAARQTVDRTAERTGMGADHTVVALAGATGSGKSSLFNALVGADVATIGARRPTTSRPTAAVFGAADATPLLDWLGVDSRHLVESPEGAEARVVGSLDGLVLLDLPDFDSREEAHRREAERVLQLVDVFVWVTDPQKYADARLHDEFVALLSRHDAVTLAVLNQTDRLTKDGVAAVTRDLSRLLVDDGVTSAQVLTTSATTCAGVPELLQRLANVVAGQAASRQRLRADLVAAATLLRRDVADTEADVAALPRTDLDAALARAAGVPIVLDAVARDYRREAFAHTGWLFGRWTSGFAADPLRRLRLDRTGGRSPLQVDVDGSDVRAVLGRSSIPAPSASAVAAVDLATRTFVRDASVGLPVRWAQAVEGSVDHGQGGLADSLDRAVLATPLRDRRPFWWFLVNALQWVLGISAATGLVWVAVLLATGWLRVPVQDVPTLVAVPWPVVLLVGGLVLGVLLGLLCRVFARAGARHRRAVVGQRLHDAVVDVADDHLLVPVDEVLFRHRTTREHLTAAGA